VFFANMPPKFRGLSMKMNGLDDFIMLKNYITAACRQLGALKR